MMELIDVGRLIAYIILTLLAADRAWTFFKPTRGEKEINGRLTSLQEEISQLHQAQLIKLVESIAKEVHDIHEDIASLQRENAAAHVAIAERLNSIPRTWS